MKQLRTRAGVASVVIPVRFGRKMRDPFGSAAVEEEYSDEEGYDGSGGAEDGGNDEELVDLGALAEAELAEDDEEGDEEGDEDDDVEGEEDEDMEDAELVSRRRAEETY